jgi:murein L,D-transpeptidase YcbB/YkuD
VGTQYDQTPIFAADLKYIVFNPTWAVPRSIVINEMLPAIKADSGYLASGGYDLLDSNGRRVDPVTVDWARITGSQFRYGLVQRPGPANALGRVKFMLPNEHAVYLHDTPARQLFSLAGRTFSHGCVRAEDPLALAALLLDDQAQWDRAAIDATVGRGVTRTVFLSKPLRVFLLYWTAEPAVNGGVSFFDDVYQRDGKLLAALDAPFRSLTPADR